MDFRMTARQIELKQRAKALTAERCQYEPDIELDDGVWEMMWDPAHAEEYLLPEIRGECRDPARDGEARS